MVRGTLSFDGRATAGDFVGTTETVSGRMTGRSLAEVKGFVEAPVNTLLTGNDRRDRDLNKSMESEKHPTLRFDLETVRPLWERGDSAGVVLVGTLTLHGVSRPRELRASLAWEGDQIRLQTTFPVDLEVHEIGGLSKMFGVLKMYPDIDVHVDLVFGPVTRAAPGEASDTLSLTYGRRGSPSRLAAAARLAGTARLPGGSGRAPGRIGSVGRR
ncbi:MAG: YceI family protein [Gemmatimonadales bacterium]